MSTPQSLTIDDLKRIFKRDDIRGLWPDELNCQVAENVGFIFACMLLATAGGIIAVGHDARTGSFELLCALAHGMERAGARVMSLGLCSSEQIYYMAGAHADEIAGCAMVTASHNPVAYNGIKFVKSGAVPFGHDDLLELERRLLAGWTARLRVDVGEEFAAKVMALSGMDTFPEQSGQPLKIVVAGGNGVGAKAFQPIGDRLAAKGIQCVYVDSEPDGSFPNGVPNPLLPAFSKRLKDAVIDAHADMGIGFDGDADRAGFVDECGQAIVPSQILAMVALDRLENRTRDAADHKAVVMCNLCCSRLLEEVVGSRADVELVWTPVGHGQMKRMMRHETNVSRVVFGGEHSGHYFYPEFYYADSSVLTSLAMIRRLAMLRQAGKTLSGELASWRQRYCWSGEVNYRMPDEESLVRLMAAFRKWMPMEEHLALLEDPQTGLPRLAHDDGRAKMLFSDVKIRHVDDNGDGWWIVIRASGNEPVLRVNVETFGGSKEARHLLEDQVETMIYDAKGHKL